MTKRSTKTRRLGGFGQPLFATTTTTATTSTGGNTMAQGTGFTTIGTRKNPQYSTTLAYDVPLIKPVLNRGELQRVVTLSPRLTAGNGIAVSVEGDTVVLRGEVGSDRERRVAEGIIRMTPGVRNVSNELRVNGAAASAAAEDGQRIDAYAAYLSRSP